MQCNADTTDGLIRYADKAAKVYAGRVQIVLLATNGEPSELQKIRGSYHLKLPIYDGRDILPQFAGQSVPRIVLIDGKGMIRMIAPGWHDEYGEAIYQKLLKIVQE